MSQFVETPTRTFDAGAALSQYRRVILSSGVLQYAGATDRSLGTLEVDAFASGDPVAVRLRTAQGTKKMVAAGTITAGAYVYGAASGKIDDVGYLMEGIALEAASADGDIIEVQPLEAGPHNVASVAAAGSAQGDAATLTAGINTVSAADGTKGVILPAAVAGLVVEVYNEHASNGLKVYPATGDDINDGTANAAVTIEGKTLARFTALDTSTWAAIYTVNT